MKKTRKSMALWVVVATVWSLSALNVGRLHAENITWHPGVLHKAGTLKRDTVAAGKYALTTKGFAFRNYVLIGWSPLRKPVVRDQAMEDKIRPLYRIGADSLRIMQDTMLYAVWAVDANNNGYPDYREAANQLQFSKAFFERIMSELQREREAAEAAGRKGSVSLRSLPDWNINNDLLIYNDVTYFAGCWYKMDSVRSLMNDPLSWFSKKTSFRGSISAGRREMVKANRDLELVFECGGVLEDSSFVGKDQKPITRILFPNDGTTSIWSLFSDDPVMFTRIKENGEAVLKLYFVRKGTDSLANTMADWNIPMSHMWHPSEGGTAPHPFVNPQTGAASDTLTFRFQIYRRPEFTSDLLRQSLSKNKVDFHHLSGTPIKYMMRSVDGWRWQPAESPLTGMEKELMGDSVSVYLKELDNEVGWAAFQKVAYLDPELFPYERLKSDPPTGGIFRTEKECEYYMELYQNMPNVPGNKVRDSLEHVVETSGYLTAPDWEHASERDRVDAMTVVFAICEEINLDPISTPREPYLLDIVYNYVVNTLHYSSEEARDIVDSRMKEQWNTVLGKRFADRVVTPDPCRGLYRFYFDKQLPPVIHRMVFIPSVEGAVVTAPGTGIHYVTSQKDFPFSVKYSGMLMKVTTNRMVNGEREVLTGKQNAAGEYEYVIRRVTEDITLKFEPDKNANTVVEKAAVWAEAGSIRIHSTKGGTVDIYSSVGLLVKRISVSAGDTIVPLESGVYVVVLGNGSTHKIMVK